MRRRGRALLAAALAGAMTLPAEGIGTPDRPSFIGERITYAIRKMGITVGEATLAFSDLREVAGRPAYVITFTAKALNFYDEERIAVEPGTFRPLRVERDLNIFGRKERIVESYEAESGRVRIVKTAGGRSTEQVIEREGPVDNIYAFIYRYRRDGLFRTGEALTMRLPTAEVTIRLAERRTLRLGGESIEAFYLESRPRKYRLWFADSTDKIPLRIDGAVGVGRTAMVMTGYHAAGEEGGAGG